MTIYDTMAVLDCENCHQTNDVPLTYQGNDRWDWTCPDCDHEQYEETRLLFERDPA